MPGKNLSRYQKNLEKAAYKADKEELKEERAALVIANQTRKGVHNCPAKDAGTTHAFRARCFKQQHAGYCPACGCIFSYKHGCRNHDLKQDDLLEKCPSAEEMAQYRLDHGISLDPVSPGDAGEEEGTEDGKSKKTKGRKRSATTNKK